MQAPLHYQISEYDCVPTALINGISYLFHRNEIPPMVIRHIFLYCLDTVGRNARFGIGGTSRYAVRLVGNWLNSYKIKRFSVHTQFLKRNAVNLDEDGALYDCLKSGGVAVCNMLLTKKEEHYILITHIDSEWVYCFDSYRRSSVRGMGDQVNILDSGDGRSPNLKIKRQWFDQEQSKRFCLGPMEMRESLLILKN